MKRFGLKQVGFQPVGLKPVGFQPVELKPVGFQRFGLKRFGLNLNWPFFRTPETEIQFVEFVDFDRDVIGLGTRGHYGNIAILAALSHHATGPYLSRVRVRQVWAKFEKHEFEEVSRWAIGSEPVTLVEFI